MNLLKQSILLLLVFRYWMHAGDTAIITDAASDPSLRVKAAEPSGAARWNLRVAGAVTSLTLA